MNPSEHFYNSIANLIKLNPHWIPATVDAVQTSTSAAWEKQDIRQRGAGQHRKLVNTVIPQWGNLFGIAVVDEKGRMSVIPTSSWFPSYEGIFFSNLSDEERVEKIYQAAVSQLRCIYIRSLEANGVKLERHREGIATDAGEVDDTEQVREQSQKPVATVPARRKIKPDEQPMEPSNCGSSSTKRKRLLIGISHFGMVSIDGSAAHATISRAVFCNVGKETSIRYREVG
ncbi:uncharacterized protein UDID_01710 [Ustilago sp. UG-2017a]|nr:uncharacterized protein UDID_01710 [Ustilago sp. UG-2017a]